MPFPRATPPRPTQSGFTLLELLVVIAIAAVLTGVAVPSFRAALQSAEARTAATDFYSALNRARSEAIARNTTVSVCARDATELETPTCAEAGTAAWEDGWVVYVDSAPGTALQVGEPLGNGFTLGSIASPLSFLADGRAPAAVAFDLCHGERRSVGRRVAVSRSGRVALEPRPC